MTQEGRELRYRPTVPGGPGASAIKYDILTALLVTASQGEPSRARLALRLSLVITARYNWRSGRFAVAQKELARMWGVTERTAKREMAAMRTLGWVRVAVPAARGRVAQHEIMIARLMQDSMPLWESVGPDYAARMSGTPEQSQSNVVPLRPEPTAPHESGTIWAEASAQLAQSDAAVHRAWLSQLVTADEGEGGLTLMAPSAFAAQYVQTHHAARVLAAVALVAPDIRTVRIMGPDAR